MQVPRPRLRPDLIQVFPTAAPGILTGEDGDKHWGGGPAWEAPTRLGCLQTKPGERVPVPALPFATWMTLGQ